MKRAGCEIMRKLFLLFLILGKPVRAQFGAQKLISLFDSTTSFSGPFEARVAAFGEPLDQTRLRWNLMVPPEDLFLCEVPEMFRNWTMPRINTTAQNLPIALLVSAENCTAETKARNVMEIQAKVHSQVKNLILYSGSLNQLSPLVLEPDSAEGAEDINVGILHIPHRYARSIGFQMERRSHLSPSGADNPFLLQDGNDLWRFRINIVPYSSPRSQSSPDGRRNFYWFRFVLFALLILSPCLRAGYLWYSGGGRLMLRRNEDGRITGLQYVPAMPAWMTAARFGSQGGNPEEDTGPKTLTPAEFQALPRIKFVASELNSYADDDDSFVGTRTTTASESVETEGASIGVVLGPSSSSSYDETGSLGQGQNDRNDNGNTKKCSTNDEKSEVVDIEQPLAGSSADPESSMTTTNCCSICLDDFSPGEELILLPKCRHGFHKDCLQPWLTERQACCPLCKTTVLEESDPNESNVVEGQESNEEEPNNERQESENEDEDQQVDSDRQQAS